jgi:photosystem II stability/assembly factor-like uncharacterized protein
MKKILFIFLFPALILFSSCGKDNVNKRTSQVDTDTLTTGWKKMKFIDSTGLLDIFFINNTGFAVGTHIYKSSDGGENWSLISAPPAMGIGNFLNIGMGSEMNAVFVSADRLISTHNGGTSFITNIPGDKALSDAFFIDSTIAYAVGNSLWKTVDGGDNWSKLYDFPTTTGFSSFFFTNEKTGWVSKREGVYKTTNGGIAWQRVNTDTISLDGEGIFFLNASTGYISNTTSIERTLDGGASWNKVFACTNNTYHDIHFVSANVGYITDGPRVFKTSDGGNTWTKKWH